MTDLQAIADGLSEAQRRALITPHLLVIDNMQCVPDLDWPDSIVAYQWADYDALSETGLAVRAILQKEAQK